jgi:glucose/arabinose dehydrogenase
VQHFAFHPQFGQPGTPGAGKFYMFVDTPNQAPAPDFTTPNPMSTHDNVVLEWTAKTPGAAAYDGGRPKELFRFRDPFANHNGGFMAFNPLARDGAPDFGMLYIGIADGGSGGDPMNLSQNMASPFGKILRINPLGSNSRNKKYGIPPDNPFVAQPGALPEIWVVGVRNPQRASWDPRNGNLFVSDIGQNIVEEVSIATRGANLGWNLWEGSYRVVNRDAVSLQAPRSDPKMTYPIVEWGQLDPLLQQQSAAGGLVVYRANEIPQIANMVLFSDMPSGEMFYVTADKLPSGGQAAVRRVLFNHNGAARTLLQVIQEKNKEQGKTPATRADLRISLGNDNKVYLLNKGDGTIRVLTR